MSRTDPALSIRRILVALDASPQSLAALDAAVTMAQRMEAELAGLFVEDENLLRAAESPYAREILYPSAKESPLSRSSLERTLRTQAEKARASLSSAAQRAHVPWSFRSVRGQVTPELLAAAAQTDLIVMGKVGWSLGARFRIGSTALELIESAIPVLLLSGDTMPAILHLLVFYDGSAEAKRALEFAAVLAGADSGKLTVLLAAPDEETTKTMRAEATNLLADSDIEARWQRIDPADRAGLLRLLRDAQNGLFVLGGSEPLQKLPLLEAVLRESKVPVLLLRK